MRGARRGGPDESGQQAILLVVAISLIMFSFSLVLVTQTAQELPIINRTLIDHAAYRALQAGVADYLYAINENSNGVTCTGPTSPACAYFTTQGFAFGQFQSVPNSPNGPTGISYTPSEWTSVGYPVINQANGTIQVAVVGAAGFANAMSSIQYQTADIIFRANDTFLLNVAWSQFNAMDPTIPTSTGCTPTGYLWGGGGSNCGLGDAGVVTPSFPYYGPVFSDDEVLVCQNTNPTVYPTIDHIETAAPNLSYSGGGGCSSTVNYINPSQNLSIPKPLLPPTNINALAIPSTAQGCYYRGPTTINFLATGGYYVSSPDTPWVASNGTTITSYDGANLANNKSQCLPSANNSTAGNVTGPANGVIYVDALSGTTCQKGKLPNGSSIPANPLKSAYDANGYTYDGEGPSPQCNGDAIVSGVVTGGYTLAAQNDIMIDRNVTYADCPTLTTADQKAMNSTAPLGEWTASKQCNTIAPNTVNGQPNLINDTLGLIANNFVSINNPLKNGNLVAACSGSSLTPDCSNPNPIIMASILALGHTFSVPNFCSSPGVVGTIDFYGSLAEKYIDVEECGGWGGNYGYGVTYTWDSRLSILSPPQFFSPSTPAWLTQAFSVTVGKCSTVWPVNTATCPASL